MTLKKPKDRPTDPVEAALFDMRSKGGKSAWRRVREEARASGINPRRAIAEEMSRRRKAGMMRDEQQEDET